MGHRLISLGGKAKRSAIVDAEDYQRVRKFRWCLSGEYVVRKTSNGFIGLQQEVLGVSRNILVDHRDCNPLNNQRDNLRIASHSQNMANKRLSPLNTSGFKGVTHSDHKKWVATITHQGKNIRLGLFDSPQLAALAYDEAARKLFGDFARYNFPKTGEQAVHVGPVKPPQEMNYFRTTVCIPRDVWSRIRKFVDGRPGLTVSAMITDAASAYLEDKQ